MVGRNPPGIPHASSRTTDVIGSLVYFDEYVGKHRLKFKGRITGYATGKAPRIQVGNRTALPAWLVLELQDRPDGVDIVHTVRAGYRGIGKMLDPLIRLYLSSEFEEALNQHAATEFPRLGDLLR